MGEFMIASLVLILNLFCSSAQALTMQVWGEHGELLASREYVAELPSTVGDQTISVFDQMGVPYLGSIYGIHKIYELDQRIDVLSDTEMKAYGWCFSVDGLTPETLTHETVLLQQSSVVQWYYAYAHYKDGEWIGQCVRPVSSAQS